MVHQIPVKPTKPGSTIPYELNTIKLYDHISLYNHQWHGYAWVMGAQAKTSTVARLAKLPQSITWQKEKLKPPKAG